MNTFLDKVEGAFTEMKEEMIRLFGDHTGIHDVAQDAKEKVLAAASEHFPATPEKESDETQTQIEAARKAWEEENAKINTPK